MSNMRDDFEAAIGDLDADLSETPQEVLGEDEPEVEASGTSTEDNGIGDSEEDNSGAVEESRVGEEDPQEQSAIPESDTGAEEASKDSVKAPVDWSPKQREDWSKIPRHLQDKIVSREADMTKHMAGTGEARKSQEFIQGVQQQFGQIMQMEGFNNPQEAITGVFNTISQLRSGTQNEKANLVAGLIKQYGVDVNALDNVLVGQPAPQSAPQDDALNQRLAPMEQFLHQQQQQQQYQQQQNQQMSVNEVQEFAKSAEFINDVRMDMADLVDMAHARGVSMPLQDAYNKACAMNPEISNIMSKRAQDQQILGGQTTLAAKRNAASSLNGRIGSAAGANTNMSMRQQLASAWDGMD